MNKKYIPLLFAIIPALVILLFLSSKLYTTATGTEILLKTAPVDPRDLFRGDYVTLSYEINTIGPYALKGKEFSEDETIFTILSIEKGLYELARERVDSEIRTDAATLVNIYPNLPQSKIANLIEQEVAKAYQAGTYTFRNGEHAGQTINLTQRTQAIAEELSKNQIESNGKFWIIDYVSKTKPQIQRNQVCLKGRVISSTLNNVRASWGIESYFVPEGKGKPLEMQRSNLSVIVIVDSSCHGIVKELLINDKAVEFK